MSVVNILDAAGAISLAGADALDFFDSGKSSSCYNDAGLLCGYQYLTVTTDIRESPFPARIFCQVFYFAPIALGEGRGMVRGWNGMGFGWLHLARFGPSNGMGLIVGADVPQDGEDVVMQVESNWMQPIPGLLFDPILKIQVRLASFGPETGANQAAIWCAYDPDFSAERIHAPLSAMDERKWRELGLNPPEKILFKSENYRYILQGIFVKWETVGSLLIVKVESSLDSFEIRRELLSRGDIPSISDRPVDFLLKVLEGLALLDAFKGDLIVSDSQEITEIEVLIPSEVAEDFFKIDASKFSEVDPGWVSIAMREEAA